jgi:hypothetical protein
VQAKPSLLGLLLLLVIACASPREKAYQAAVSDYNRNQASVVAFTQANVKQLITATKAFRSKVGRWPETYQEFGNYAVANNLPVDLTAFNDVAFAVLGDGNLQVHYDMNCSRFSTKQYQFVQTGTVTLKVR